MARRLFPALRRQVGGSSRRELLAAAAGIVAASCVRRVPPPVEPSTEVAIVGAGLAGLSAALRLQEARVGFTLYEARPRAGGRTLTDRTTFPGRWVDLGGELVDSWHSRVHRLCSMFGVELLDRWRPGLTALTVVAGGRRYTLEDLKQVEETVSARLRERLGGFSKDPLLVTAAAPHGLERIDAMSAGELLRSLDLGEWLPLIERGFTSLYGGEPDTASGLVLAADVLGVGPESDERYTYRGGASSLVERMVAALHREAIRYEAPLEALSRAPDGRYRLEVGGQTVTAGAVVLALPFSTLREVRLEIPLSELKRRAIAELGHGASSKVCVGYRRRVWVEAGASGAVLSDSVASSVWETTGAQPSKSAVATFYLGGREAREVLGGTLEARVAPLVADYERLFPGSAAALENKAVRVGWADEPFTRCGYALHAPGQVTAFRGAEGTPEGGVFFCGEHTSLRVAGYMEGAVESGEAAAEALLSTAGRFSSASRGR